MTAKRNEDRYDYMVKLVIIGDTAVGKTNILLRFVNDEYKINHVTTIGVDFKVKIVPIDGLNIKMQIWDTAGQQRFKTITESYYKGAAGVIFVYSVTQRRTFDNLANWIKQVTDSHPEAMTKIIVGNKCDCKESERQVSFTEASKFAKSCGIELLEASAKENINIADLFEKIGLQIKKKLVEEGEEEGNKASFKLGMIDKGLFKKEDCNC